MSPRYRLIVIGPLPPPLHGVTVSTQLVLQNRYLHDAFHVEHLDTSDHRSGENIGTWDPVNVALGIASVAKLITKTMRARGTVYLPLSQSHAALVRDTLLIRIASLSGWRVAAHLRGSELRPLYHKSHPLFRWWLRSVFRRLDSLAVMGLSIVDSIDGLVPTERVTVVPNGTPDIGVGSGGNGTVVLFLSNLRRRKGVVESVRAALLVLELRPDVRLSFAGEWESLKFEAEVKEIARPAGERIEFVPAATSRQKISLLHAASVLLFPPVEPEGHPRVVLEALAAGVPVVTTDRGAIRETVVDGESGFVLDHPTPAKLAERILRIINNAALRERMSKAARVRYVELFTQERADRLLSDWLIRIATGGESSTRDPARR